MNDENVRTHKPALVGLTGGIGSGKSTVARLFRELGACTVSADEIARTLTEPDMPEFRAILDVFGDSILDTYGEIDRTVLGEQVFSDPEKRRELESILHPSIRTGLYDRCSQCRSVYCIMEIPLLIESGQYLDLDRTIAVTCKSKIRRQRLQANRNMDAKRFRSIMEAQLSDAERIAAVDDVIVNDSDLESLTSRVRELHTRYLDLFSS